MMDGLIDAWWIYRCFTSLWTNAFQRASPEPEVGLASTTYRIHFRTVQISGRKCHGAKGFWCQIGAMLAKFGWGWVFASPVWQLRIYRHNCVEHSQDGNKIHYNHRCKADGAHLPTGWNHLWWPDRWGVHWYGEGLSLWQKWFCFVKKHEETFGTWQTAL